MPTPAQLDSRTPQRHLDVFPTKTCFRLTIVSISFLLKKILFSRTPYKTHQKTIPEVPAITKLLSQKINPAAPEMT
jgi:hypothetical protein